MKKLKLPQTLLVTMATPALVALVVPTGQALAQGQTETKIRLMADALRARDNGDLETAKKNLEELLALAPNDATVQRLLAGVNASIAARAEGAVAEVSTPEVSAAEPVQVSLQQGVPSLSQQAKAKETEVLSQADLLAKQEEERIESLVSQARAKRGEARSLARDGKFDEAGAVLDGAIAALPASPATEGALNDLRAERNGLLLEQAQQALKQGDTEAARKFLDSYASASSDTRRVEKTTRAIDKAELNPPLKPIEVVNPKFIADQKEIAKQLAKGRSQYLAGDIDGAQETYRYVEALDASNPEAKSFLKRIAAEKATTGVLNRGKTSAEMLEEVGNAWQRPGIYIESAPVVEERNRVTPLAKKLNDIKIPSVNFSGVELSRVVSTLSAISPEYDKSEGSPGVNIVLIDPSNKNPSINITLRDLSLRRILDLITDSIGYQYEVQDDTVVVRPGGDASGGSLENAFFPVSRAAVIRMTGIGAGAAPAASADPFAAAPAPSAAGAGPGGESAALQAFLEQAGVRFNGVNGASLVYDGAAIIVNQTSRNIEKIRNILNRYSDVRQVEIETKFMDVQEGVLEELGVQWVASSDHGIYASGSRNLSTVFSPSGATSQGVIQQANAAPTPFNNSAPTLPGGVNLGGAGGGLPNNLNLQIPAPVQGGSLSVPVPSGSLAAMFGTIGEFEVGAIIRALSQKSGTELLSAPKVTVLSGNPANIVVAQELRYPQSYGEIQSTVSSSNTGGAAISVTAGTPQEFTVRNVGVELKVTPTVEEDNYSISLDLNPRVTEFDGFVEYGGQSVALTNTTTVTIPPGFYQPIFSTRELTTKVTVWDGATLVMGGLTREEVKKVDDKIPILGDIPLIGRAFRNKGETSSKRNLLIFVTANLVSPGGSPKNQRLKSIAPASTFQNPTIVTPGGSESRVRGGK